MRPKQYWEIWLEIYYMHMMIWGMKMYEQLAIIFFLNKLLF